MSELKRLWADPAFMVEPHPIHIDGDDCEHDEYVSIYLAADADAAIARKERNERHLGNIIDRQADQLRERDAEIERLRGENAELLARVEAFKTAIRQGQALELSSMTMPTTMAEVEIEELRQRVAELEAR